MQSISGHVYSKHERAGHYSRRLSIVCAAISVVTSASTRALAAPTVLDFEDLAPGTTVTAQYGARGVLFDQDYLDSDPVARSGTRVLRNVNPAAEVFTPIPLIMTFTSAQASTQVIAN